MYSASTAFHTAVASNAPQKALLIFADAVFTNEDINIERGIEFHDYFNLEEDLSIGQTPSNELSFSLFNADRLLNDYAFGDFLATIGVLTGTGTASFTGNAHVITANVEWIGKDASPYLTRGGQTLLNPPSFPVKSLLAYDGKVYAFGANKQYAVFNASTGANVTTSNPVNAFMRNKSIRWNGQGMEYNKATRILKIWSGTKMEQYEFVPLGYFTAERPKAPDVLQIDFNCNDLMMKFDKDMPSASALGLSYPCTIGTLFVKLCQNAGLPYKSSTFINSTATIASEPEEFERAGMRQVLQWIAEAAGGNIRIDRDGYVTVDWLRTTTQRFGESDYGEFNPYWYATKQVTKLLNRGTDGSYEHAYGNGTEGYLIQDNPLLKGVS